MGWQLEGLAIVPPIFPLKSMSRLERVPEADTWIGHCDNDDAPPTEEAAILVLQSDGKELPPDGELQSGIRRSERLELLHGESTHESRADGNVVLKVKIPIRSAPQLVS